MTAAAKIMLGEGCFIVTAPDGNETRFKRHDQALDYADMVLREQRRLSRSMGATAAYRIVSNPGSGAAFRVVDPAGRVVASLSTREYALNKVDELARQQRIRVRPCITCGTRFESEGAHNRMCTACRWRAQDMGGL